MEFVAKTVFLVIPAVAESNNGNWRAGHNFCCGYCDIALMRRCALEPDFLAQLQKQCNERAPFFAPPTKNRLVINLLAYALGGPVGLRDPITVATRPAPTLKAC